MLVVFMRKKVYSLVQQNHLYHRVLLTVALRVHSIDKQILWNILTACVSKYCKKVLDINITHIYRLTVSGHSQADPKTKVIRKSSYVVSNVICHILFLDFISHLRHNTRGQIPGAEENLRKADWLTAKTREPCLFGGTRILLTAHI